MSYPRRTRLWHMQSSELSEGGRERMTKRIRRGEDVATLGQPFRKALLRGPPDTPGTSISKILVMVSVPGSHMVGASLSRGISDGGRAED